MNKMTSKLIKYFFTGLAVLLPLALSISFIAYLVSKLDVITNINFFLIEMFIILAFVFIVGFLSNVYFGNKIGQIIEEWLIKIPIFGFLYKSMRDVTTAFVGHDKKFTEPVAVKLNGDNIYKLGFITTKSADLISLNISDDSLIAVYFPISFSIAGDLFLVPESQIKIVNEKPKEMMQYIISGGVINLK